METNRISSVTANKENLQYLLERNFKELPLTYFPHYTKKYFPHYT